MESTRVKLDASIMAMLEKIKTDDPWLQRTHGMSKTIRHLANFYLKYKSLEALLEKKLVQYNRDLADHEKFILEEVNSVPEKIFNALGNLIKGIMVRGEP